MDGLRVPLRTTVSWDDEASPWAAGLTTEQVVDDADVERYVRAAGPRHGRDNHAEPE